MKTMLLMLSVFAVLALGACTKNCATCTIYDGQSNILGEYTACSDNPEEEAEENFCKSGCEGELKAVCTEQN